MRILWSSIKSRGSALGLVALAATFLGCAAKAVTVNGPAEAARPPTCDFEILTTAPPVGYREIGTVDITPGPFASGFRDLDDFKEDIRKDVCRLGGDAAVAHADVASFYTKASVMKRFATQPPPPAPTPVPVPVPNAVAKPPESHGCEFDTQCKADRICLEGKCQAPAPSAAPTAAPAATATTSAASAPTK